jgi:hypothetical protein
MSRLTRWTQKHRQKRLVVEYANDFNKLVLKLPDMTEDEKIYSFISGLQTEVKLQVELHRLNDLQTAKEIADLADTIIFQAKRFSRRRGGPSLETASGNWPNHVDEAMKLGAARLTDSEREKYMKEGKFFRCGQKCHRANQHNADRSPQKARQPWPWTARKRRKLPRENKNRKQNDKKRRTSALYSRYDALQETYCSEDKVHEEISSSET